jgi:hypothetical protein
MSRTRLFLPATLTNKALSRLYSLGLLASLISTTSGFAANLNLEQLAKQIAEQFNANPPKADDGFTSTLTAKSVGKNVIYSYLWNYRLDTPKSKIDQLVSEWKAEMIPQVCQNHAKDEAFKQGLYYTFIYFDKSNKKVTEYSVSRDTCTNLRK